MQKPLMARAAGFAHLLGLSPKSKRAENEEDEKKDLRRAEEDDESAEDEDIPEKEREEDTEDGEEDDKKAKKAKKARKATKAEDDEEDDEELEEDEEDKEQAARRAERSRCAAIFRCASAGVRPDMAAHLAFETGMSAKKAIAMLDVAAAGAQRRSPLSERMAGLKNPAVGSGSAEAPDASSPKGVAAMINAAAEKARGR